MDRTLGYRALWEKERKWRNGRTLNKEEGK